MKTEIFILIHKIKRKYRTLSLRNFFWSLQGAHIGSQTILYDVDMTWPHQVSIGKCSTIESRVWLKYIGIFDNGPSIIIGNRVFIGRECEFNIRSKIDIHDNCMIGSGCKFVDHNHGIDVNTIMNMQVAVDAPILIEEDVWLGSNVIVLLGVTIGKGAVVGAGAVITKSIPPYEIWAGIPARKIGCRK